MTAPPPSCSPPSPRHCRQPPSAEPGGNVSPGEDVYAVIVQMQPFAYPSGRVEVPTGWCATRGRGRR